jgi:hypothetical protein
MNIETIPPKPDVLQACVDSLLMTLLERDERIADLESDNAALRETLHASVELNHHQHEQIARLKVCLRRDLWETHGAIIERRVA